MSLGDELGSAAIPRGSHRPWGLQEGGREGLMFPHPGRWLPHPYLRTAGGLKGELEVSSPQWMITPFLPPDGCEMMLSQLQQLQRRPTRAAAHRALESPRQMGVRGAAQPGEDVSSKASQGNKQYLLCSLPFTFAAVNGS